MCRPFDLVHFDFRKIALSQSIKNVITDQRVIRWYGLGDVTKKMEGYL